LLKKFDTSILDVLQAAAYIRDVEMNVCYFNPVAERLTGVSREEAEQLKCWQIFGDVDESCRENCPAEAANRVGKPLSILEGCVITKDGKRLSVAIAVTPLVQDNRPLGTLILLESIPKKEIIAQKRINTFSGLEQEIERRKAIETMLRREKQLFMGGPVVIFHWKNVPGWPVEYVSENISQFGYSAKQFVAGELYLSQIIHADDAAKVIAEVKRYSNSGSTSFEQEYRIITSSGEERWVTDFTRVIYEEDDGITYYYGYMFDITERKRAWEEVRRSRDMLDKVLDTIPQAVFWKDRQGLFLGCNRVFAATYGFDDPDQLIGLTDYDMPVPRQHSESFRAMDREVIETNRPKLHIIEPIYHNNGKIVWRDTSKAPLLDGDGVPFGVLGVFDDITERKAMEDALEKRIIALTMPLDDPEGIEFEDLFNIEDLQELQDAFCNTSGVAGLIVHPDGRALSKPSNFCRLCREMIRKNSRGYAHCVQVEGTLAKAVHAGPQVQQCLATGFWHAGAAICVGGKHLASWLIGQVRDDSLNEESIRQYAKRIGGDETEMVCGFREVPVMAKEQFGIIAKALTTLTNYLSTLAYQNVQQARYITQRKKAEEELLKSREEMAESKVKLSLALSMAKMGQWEGRISEDEDTPNIFIFNDQFYEMYGTNAAKEGGYEMLLETYVKEFFHPEDVALMDHEVTNILSTTVPNDFRQTEHRIIRRDGEVRHIAVRYRILRNEQGELFKTIGVNQDITEQKIAEAKLLKAKQEAEAANRAKSVFLANMSHELRTPINGLMGMLQLMQASKPQPEHEEYIDNAIRSSKRLTRLLSDILDISRVEAGKMQVSYEPFLFRDSLDSLFQLFVPMAKAKGIDLRMFVDDSIPRNLVGDALRLQQIIGNLIGNAVKFTLRGGVKVAVHSLVPFGTDPCRLLFCVADTGIGIADHTVGKLFTPFVQEEERYRHQFGGAGLGLAIAKQLTELMGGSLAVASEEGKGSTFYLCLPFGLVESSKEEDPVVEPETYGIGRYTVLLAEDDAISRMVAEQLLSRAGFSVTGVQDGQQALAALRKTAFDLVIMDVQMPLLDGVQATRVIREGGAGEHNRGVPIIAMTACAMREDKEIILRSGMDGYVEKPMEVGKLLEEIAKCIGLQR